MIEIWVEPVGPLDPADLTILDARERRRHDEDVGREEQAVGFWVREPFPSIATATNLRAGKLTDMPLTVTSRMNEGVSSWFKR